MPSSVLSFQDRLAQAEMDLQKAKQDKKHYDDKLKEHEKAKADLRKTVEAREAEIDVGVSAVTCGMTAVDYSLWKGHVLWALFSAGWLDASFLQEDTAKAQELCEKIRTRRTVQNLQSEILQIQKRISREEKKYAYLKLSV